MVSLIRSFIVILWKSGFGYPHLYNHGEKHCYETQFYLFRNKWQKWHDIRSYMNNFQEAVSNILYFYIYLNSSLHLENPFSFFLLTNYVLLGLKVISDIILLQKFDTFLLNKKNDDERKLLRWIEKKIHYHTNTILIKLSTFNWKYCSKGSKLNFRKI